MNWYEDEIQRLEKEYVKLSYSPKMIFYGSSSIRMWDSLYEDFYLYKPINLGFGGSTLEACVYYFNRVMQPYHPQYLVIYAGENDLGDGRLPQQVMFFFKQLVKVITGAFRNTTVFYVSIKPSIARWPINQKIRETNSLIAQAIQSQGTPIHFIDVYTHMLDKQGRLMPDLYIEDGLHLSKKGYNVWKQVLERHFSMNIDSNII